MNPERPRRCDREHESNSALISAIVDRFLEVGDEKAGDCCSGVRRPAIAGHSRLRGTDAVSGIEDYAGGRNGSHVGQFVLARPFRSASPSERQLRTHMGNNYTFPVWGSAGLKFLMEESYKPSGAFGESDAMAAGEGLLKLPKVERPSLAHCRPSLAHCRPCLAHCLSGP